MIHIIGLRSLDDLHLQLMQSVDLVSNAMQGGPGLPEAIQHLLLVLLEHNILEDSLLRFLPQAEADEHRRTHARALMLLREYHMESAALCYPGLHRILTMIRSHHNSEEEHRLAQVLQDAIKSGRLSSRS